jgi:hypothetical protein
MLYVPIFFSDDSPPIIGDFPNVNDRQAVLNYVYSPTELGTISMTIMVDGTMNSLGSDYVFAVGNVKLGDGPGTRYLGFAAFLTPLNKGTHTVEIVCLIKWCTHASFLWCPTRSDFRIGHYLYSDCSVTRNNKRPSPKLPKFSSAENEEGGPPPARAIAHH